MGDGMRDYRLYEVGICVYFVFFVYFEDWLWEWYGVWNFFDYDIYLVVEKVKIWKKVGRVEVNVLW